MASHGGILGLFFYTLWYSRRHHLSWTGLGDNLVVVAPIGLFFGRVANFINGELYGRIATVPWAMQFPRELEDPGIAEVLLPRLVPAAADLNMVGPLSITPDLIVNESRHNPLLRDQLGEVLNPRHPSQLYEAFLEGIVLFAILWFVRTRLRNRNGVLTGIFFIAYALLRIIGEAFREPDAPLFGPLSRGQFLSLFMIVIGAAFLLWSRYQTPRSR